MTRCGGLLLSTYLLAFSSGLVAQYPGQQAPGQYPPGQYPPGQGPMGGGGSGIPVPWGHKKSQKKKDDSGTAAAPTFSAEGKTVSNDGKKLVIDTADGRTITLSISDQTKWTRSGSDLAASKFVPRTTVHVDAAEDDEANLKAVHVDLLKDAPVESASTGGERRSSQRVGSSDDEGDTTPPPTIMEKPTEAPNRPVLRHGKPKESESTDDSVDMASNTPAGRPSAQKSAADTPKSEQPKSDEPADFTIDSSSEHPHMIKDPSQDLIARTKEWAASFSSGLPNFVCQQMTTRYLEQSRSAGWDALDVVTAKVIYEDGHEKYQEITVGGKRTNKSMLELGGATSTGEFASTLQSLFSPRSRAKFTFYRSTTVRSTVEAIYDFKVALTNSDWFINVGGQGLHPAYSGSVWIDKSTAEVRRIEMQAEAIPQDFPLDSVEWAVEYDDVPLGTAKFLLPVHAENLSCQRGSPICTKNSVDFRDYHKYSGESTITFK